MGSPSLLQGVFPTQGLNRGLPHCRRILYQLSHKGSIYAPAHNQFTAGPEFYIFSSLLHICLLSTRTQSKVWTHRPPDLIYSLNPKSGTLLKRAQEWMQLLPFCKKHLRARPASGHRGEARVPPSGGPFPLTRPLTRPLTLAHARSHHVTLPARRHTCAGHRPGLPAPPPEVPGARLRIQPLSSGLLAPRLRGCAF